MVFSSLLFLFRFLPIVLLCYFLAPKKLRNFILLIASLMFYAWGEPIYVCLLLFSSVLDYTMGRLIGKCRESGKKGGMRACLLTSLVVNLSLLGVFKYADFFIRTINNICGLDISLPGLALPIGISFYTFQTLSYTIDVYWGKVAPQRNFINFGAYVALFPQLIAGPIVRYQTIAEELDDRQIHLDDISEGVCRFSTGLAKKVLLANSIGAVFTEIAGMPQGQLSTLTAWIGVIAFTFQIYFDFSGYSDMAIGLGRIFGFHFLENFDHPYESKSITEFWRRWHISLGTWFKEYVYIPLGGNRCGLPRQMLHIGIVWLLTGFWHGASWNFVLWGVYYGVLLVLEKLFLLKILKKLPGVLTHIYTMVLVIVGWAFFCYSDLSYAGDFVCALVGHAGNGWVDAQSIYILLTNLVLFGAVALGSTSIPVRIGGWLVRNKNCRSTGVLKGALVLVCLFLSVTFLVSDSFNPFLYFRF